jgi:NAD(P)-dependent dehydrogenase (short-subunit alcohol dehydrogenase family)
MRHMSNPSSAARRSDSARPPVHLASSERPICVVTGATAGIGRAIAQGIAARGGHLVLVCRDRGRGLEAAHEISWRTGAPAEILLADLTDRSSIRRAAEEALARFGRLDVLVNNAAVWSVDRVETREGIERTWAVNVLAYHALMRLLEPRFVRGTRIVNIASGLAHGLELDDVEFKRRRYRGVSAYAQSKQADRRLTRAFARRFDERGICVNSVHPGFTRTRAFANGGGVQGLVAGLGALLFGKPPARAAQTALWLALDREIEGMSGGYFEDHCERPCAYTDMHAEDALFDLCERMSGVV